MNQVLLTIVLLAAPVFVPYLIGRAVWLILHNNNLIIYDDPDEFSEHYRNGWSWILVLSVGGVAVYGIYLLVGVILK